MLVIEHDEGGVDMRARPGQQIIVRGHWVGEHERRGRILGVHGHDGRPPYLVRWDDTGRESLLFPGTDAFVDHVDHVEPAH